MNHQAREERGVLAVGGICRDRFLIDQILNT
jgi:hypothetical protein